MVANINGEMTMYQALYLLNASGHRFRIWERDGSFTAEQITGCERNYMNAGALLHADSYAAIKRDLRSHYSN